tara:strand:- start:9286 stop:9651 length:366 start_codon:yes stop_codon:yes gene_type:complete
MNELSLSKEQLRDALLVTGYEVLDYIPERVIPPVIVIGMRSPYVSPDTLGNGWLMNLELLAIASNATNDFATERVDEMIQSILQNIPAYCRIVSVQNPQSMSVNNAEYLGVGILVELSIEI